MQKQVCTRRIGRSRALVVGYMGAIDSQDIKITDTTYFRRPLIYDYLFLDHDLMVRLYG